MVHPSRFGRIFGVVALGFFSMCITAQAQQFSTPTNLSNNADYSLTPRVAVDAAGAINVVWQDQTASNANVLFSRSSDGGMTFSTPKNVSNSAGFSSSPRIAVDSHGGIEVVWVDNTPGNQDIFFSRSTDGGVTFSTPKNLSNDAADNGNPQLAVDASGNVSVVWENVNIIFGIFFSHSSDGGVTFSNPVNLATNPTGSYSPQLAVDTVGNINVVWEDDFSAQSDICFVRSTDKGATFSAPKNVSNNLGASVGAQIAVAPNGNIDVAWTDNTTGNNQILFSRSTDQGATFSNANNLSNGTYDSSNPQIQLGTNGSVYVAWQEIVPPSFNNEIFLARSSDGGASFLAPVNVSNNAGNSSAPCITVDANGSIDLNWVDTTPGRDNTFFARSVDGGTTFSTPQNLSNDSGFSSDGHLAADKNGNVNVVWSDDSSGVNQILFSRFTNPQVTNHPPVANAGPDQTLECAGHGGTLVTLNGSGSSDPDGDVLSYIWTDEWKNLVGTTAMPQFTIGMGAHTFTLTVTDPAGLKSTAATHVTVRDTVGPALKVSLSSKTVWLHDHRFVQVTAAVQASDVCDANVTIQLVSITSNDRDGANHIRAIGGGAVLFGTDVRSFLWRVDRGDEDKDRVLTVTYMAKDASGNTTLASAQVYVGKTRSRKSRDDDRDEHKRRREHDRD